MRIASEKSPSAAFSLASRAAQLHGHAGMDTLALAKATRWLAVIRRDYGEKAFLGTVGTPAAMNQGENS